MTLTEGDWTRLGPTLTPDGVNFAVFAPRAHRIDLCLHEVQQGRLVERTRLSLPGRRDGVFHGLLAGAGAGIIYSLRAHGPADPSSGLHFDPSQELLDPYAPRIVGDVLWTSHGAVPPRGAVVDHAFDWDDDRPARTPWSDTLIYEAHIKGLTATHPDVPPDERGTYRGIAHPAVIAHLKELGVTALELLPVQARISERRLHELGLSNYWGYGTLGFFAPDPRFAHRPGQEVREFKEMVHSLHSAGIEVLLDVVYNHTIEGNAAEPPLSLRGLANTEYYRLDHEHPRRAVDWTGCGNTLDLSRDPALRLVLDSLRCWVRDYHVDGFRFDLAPALFRDRDGAFQPHGRFAAALHQDPVLASCKLIAEPWDLGPHGYRLGEHPRPFREWNDRFRDTVRRFWRGDPGQLPDLASRLGGSSDRFGGLDPVHPQPRGPLTSINYVTCHDGFTLADLVSYKDKRNEDNGEQNRDGSDQNWSKTWGSEGPTGDVAVQTVRSLVARSLLATTVLAQGVPMIAHGDELGRTQRGNNNAYCQDNPISWIDWDGADRELLDFVQHLTRLRRDNGVFRRSEFLGPLNATWLRADGRPMEVGDWGRTDCQVLGLLLTQEDDSKPLRDARPALMLLNGGPRPARFCLPSEIEPDPLIVLDTSRPILRSEQGPANALWVPAHGLIVLERASSST